MQKNQTTLRHMISKIRGLLLSDVSKALSISNNTPVSTLIKQGSAKENLDARNNRRNQFDVRGEIKPTGSGAYEIAGVDFVLDTETWIFGDILPGCVGQVSGIRGEDGKNHARKVVISR